MKQTEKKAHQTNTFRNDFQNEATLVMENKKQTRGERVTAATVNVRVFFFHYFGEKCSKMKIEKYGKKGAPNCFFQKRFSKRGHSRNEK